MRTKSTIDIDIKIILGVSIYLIIVSIFGLNPFLHEVYAKASSDDSNHGTNGDSSNQWKITAAPAHGDSAKKVNTPLPVDPTKPVTPEKHHAQAAMSSSQLVPAANLAQPAPTIEGESHSEDLVSPKHDSDNHNDDTRFRHNAEDIATELSGLTPQQISNYPITDLSTSDITLVFGFLDPGNLAKVLLYIPQEDLIKIQVRLSPITFNDSLNRLSAEERKQIEDKLVSGSGNSINYYNSS